MLGMPTEELGKADTSGYTLSPEFLAKQRSFVIHGPSVAVAWSARGRRL